MVLVECSCLHGPLDLVVAFDGADVDGFPNVESLGKAAMVGPEKSKNVFLWPLVCFVDFYSVFHKLEGVDHKSNTIQELPFTGFLQDIFIEGSLVRFRDDVPCLDASFMTVVQGVQPEVLYMPTKSREHHPHVYPRNSYSADLLIILLTDLEDGTWSLRDVVEVEE